jgi:hypothetical protein
MYPGAAASGARAALADVLRAEPDQSADHLGDHDVEIVAHMEIEGRRVGEVFGPVRNDGKSQPRRKVPVLRIGLSAFDNQHDHRAAGVPQLEELDLFADISAARRLWRGHNDQGCGTSESYSRRASQRRSREAITLIAKDRADRRGQAYNTALDAESFQATADLLGHAGIGTAVGKKRTILEIFRHTCPREAYDNDRDR